MEKTGDNVILASPTHDELRKAFCPKEIAKLQLQGWSGQQSDLKKTMNNLVSDYYAK